MRAILSVLWPFMSDKMKERVTIVERESVFGPHVAGDDENGDDKLSPRISADLVPQSVGGRASGTSMYDIIQEYLNICDASSN